MRVRLTTVLVIAVCALCASATAAMATEFKANAVGKTFSEGSPGKLRGTGSGPQEFRLGIFTFTCEGAATKGAITGASTSKIFVHVRFLGCMTNLLPEKSREKLPFKVSFRGGFDIEYSSNGAAETGAESTSEVALVNPAPVTAQVAGTGCIISWPPQRVTNAGAKATGPFTAATFTNTEVANGKIKEFPSGFQHTLAIHNEFLKLVAETEGGKCGELEKAESKVGYFKGNFLEELIAGNLEVA
jgi:hypothetical protein